MAEKEYWTTESDQGNVKISEDVVASIAAISAAETEGVHGLYAGIGKDIAEFLGKKNLAKGVKITFNGNCVEVEIGMSVKYGYSILEVAKKVQESVSSAIESMTGLHTTCVDVQVGSIAFEPEQPATEE